MSLRLIPVVVLGLLAGGLVALLALPDLRARLFAPGAAPVVGQALVGGPFQLTDHTGQRVGDADFRGRNMLIYFGFTNCPDICPTGLQVMSAAIDGIGGKADRLVPMFITVDPERDTPEQLARYVSSFHPRLIGLTGTPEEIAAVAKAYRVYFQKTKDPKSSAGYTMDHSSIIFLMGPDGKYLAHFTHATPVDRMVARLKTLL